MNAEKEINPAVIFQRMNRGGPCASYLLPAADEDAPPKARRSDCQLSAISAPPPPLSPPFSPPFSPDPQQQQQQQADQRDPSGGDEQFDGSTCGDFCSFGERNL